MNISRAFILTFCTLIACALAPLRAANQPAPLNFVIILVDDWGWTDVGFTGSKLYETPHIDRLAATGVRFTNAYAACTVCSPTRASLLTGKYPARLHITDWIHGHNRPFAKLKPPQWTEHLPREETTIAEAVKTIKTTPAYATAAIGKWHLGDAAEGLPTEHGFDLNLGGTDRGQPPSYFSPYKIATLKDGPPGEYLTDREASEACNFFEANKDRPFLLYLPHYTVHTPIQAKKEKIAKYQAKIAKLKDAGQPVPQSHAGYAAMVESLDESIGAITARLDELKLRERTVIILTGDNGGLKLGGVTDNSPARAGKGSAYDGGVRVPLVIAGPVAAGGPAIKPGVCDEPVISPDLFATVIDLAGAADPRGQGKSDGMSLAPLLKDPAGKLGRDEIYWHYPHYHPGGAAPYSAVRSRDWKLIHFYEDNRVELYNLKDDIGETKDLAAANPDKATELRGNLTRWRAAVGAQDPLPNPNADQEKNKDKKKNK